MYFVARTPYNSDIMVHGPYDGKIIIKQSWKSVSIADNFYFENTLIYVFFLSIK